MGDVPVLRLGLTTEFSGHRGGRVDLQAEALAAIEPFHQKGKRFSCRPARAHHVGTVLREQAPERLAVERTTHDDRLRFRAIDDLPALADGCARR